MTIQFRDESGETRLRGDLLATGGATGDVLTRQTDGTYAPDTPSGGSVVSCLLACADGIDIRQVALRNILWDALYDNAVDLNALASIPTGLGLTFLFNGTAATITATAAGTWSFAYSVSRAADDTWAGQLLLAALDRSHQLTTGLVSGAFTDVKTDVLTLPSGAAIVPVIDTETQATENPHTAFVYLSIVRLG